MEDMDRLDYVLGEALLEMETVARSVSILQKHLKEINAMIPRPQNKIDAVDRQIISASQALGKEEKVSSLRFIMAVKNGYPIEKAQQRFLDKNQSSI